MKNLKIGVRLGLGFGLVVLLLMMISIISITRLKAGGEKTEEMINDRYVKMALTFKIRAAFDSEARNLRNVLLATTPADRKAMLDLQKKSEKETSISLDKMETLIRSPKERELFQTLRDTRVKYQAASNQDLKLIIESGEKDKAVEFLFNNVIPSQIGYRAALDAMAAFQSELMDRGGQETIEQAHSATIMVTVLSAIAILLAAMLGIIITRSITVPLGDAVKLAKTVAVGDLTMRVNASSKDETGQLLQALKEMSDSLARIVSQVRTGTDTIATASSQIASGNLDLSSRTEEQASVLEETASSMEELTSTVKHNAENARNANGLAVLASEVAVKGGVVVSQVVDTMNSINDSSKKIADIIGVIDGIAFQTNILALNAAVEAARAGEQGRGFAVVASEVRGLAQRSAAAAKEIKALIDDSVEQVDMGNKLVVQAGATMDEVVSNVKRVTDIVGEISVASQEQSAGIEQINRAITQMDDVTQQNAALVEEAAAASQSLQEQAGNLAHIVGVFKLTDTHSLTHQPSKGLYLAHM